MKHLLTDGLLEISANHLPQGEYLQTVNAVDIFPAQD